MVMSLTFEPLPNEQVFEIPKEESTDDSLEVLIVSSYRFTD